MPEGDSLQRIAARLQPLVGRTVSASSPNPRGQVTGVAAAIDGRRLESVEAVGKHLLLRFEGPVTVRSHLRMSGKWTVGPAAAARRGSPWLVLRAGAVEAAQWNGPILTLETRAVERLGPDLLADTTDPAALVPRFRGGGSERLLGEVLRDQRLVAGIGNLWMSEALWAVALSPWLPLTATDDVGAGGRSVVGSRRDAGRGGGVAAPALGLPPRGTSMPPLSRDHSRPWPGGRQPHGLLVPWVPAWPVSAGGVTGLQRPKA